jgi:hypothetical protein
LADSVRSVQMIQLTSVLSVSDGIPDGSLQERPEDSSSLLVDQSRDTLDTSSTSETTNGGLGDSLDVVTQHLPVTLSTSLSET